MIRRIWLDWSKPCLDAAAHWLVSECKRGAIMDLSDHVCVLPGRRGGRLLLNTLLEFCKYEDLQILPPRILTPGSLANHVLRASRAIATEPERKLAWMSAIRNAKSSTIDKLISHFPEKDNIPAWHELADRLYRLNEELAGDCVIFEDVAKAVSTYELDNEQLRWEQLAQLHNEYEKILNDNGLKDPDDAALEAVEEGNINQTCKIVLIGIADLNRQSRKILEAFSDRVTALVHSPEDLSDRFDEFGCVNVDAWINVQIDINDDDLIVADRERDQIQAALRTIGSFKGKYKAEEIVIGLGDETIGLSLARAAKHVGIVTHLASGEFLRHTRPYLLLSLAAEWLSERRFSNLASLLRHVDVVTYMTAQNVDSEAAGTAWLNILDKYFTDHLHEHLDGNWLGDDRQQEQMKLAYNAVETLFAPLAGSAKSLSEWCGDILSVLKSVYGSIDSRSTDQRDRVIIEACKAIHRCCSALTGMPDELQPAINSAAALRIVLATLKDVALPLPVRRDQIEALGWLEVHLDPAKAQIITGFNDGNIPKTLNADPFLPDSLRKRLGLTDNARRYARDAYLLEATRNSREQFVIIAGRRDAEGQPLVPSRLLLACDREELPDRIMRLSDEKQAKAWITPLGSPKPAAKSEFIVPDAIKGSVTLKKLRVTRFKDYLACPYRFWLSHIEGLKSVSDHGDELDPLMFGHLTHEILKSFGRNTDIRESLDKGKIASYLKAEKDRVAKEFFGPTPMPAVRIQLARLEQRLEALAHWQAKHRNEGWRIEASELRLPDNAHLIIPEQDSIQVSGIIDRVDTRDDECLLIDYKTSESGVGPQKTHGPNKDGDWKDLQLPLYDFLYRSFVNNEIKPENMRLAYVTIPKKASDVDLKCADWTPDQIEDAIETARDIVKKIRDAQFEMNWIKPEYDEFRNICQTVVFASDSQIDEEEAE